MRFFCVNFWCIFSIVNDAFCNKKFQKRITASELYEKDIYQIHFTVLSVAFRAFHSNTDTFELSREAGILKFKLCNFEYINLNYEVFSNFKS